SLARGELVGVIRTGDVYRVDASAAGTGALSTQERVMCIHYLPVGRGVSVTNAINGLVRRDSQHAGIGTGIRDCVIDRHRHHFVIGRPERVWGCLSIVNYRRRTTVFGRKNCQREQTCVSRKSIVEWRADYRG